MHFLWQGKRDRRLGVEGIGMVLVEGELEGLCFHGYALGAYLFAIGEDMSALAK